jgi:hypothetical protein
MKVKKLTLKGTSEATPAPASFLRIDTAPTIPRAHGSTQATIACAERNSHIDCTGWLSGVYGTLICGCWCHRLGGSD